MQVMAILRRRIEAFSEAQFSALLDVEAEGVRRLYAEGIVRAAWSRADVPGGILLLEAADAATAERALSRLPLVHAEMMEVQIVELRPYRGFVPQ